MPGLFHQPVSRRDFLQSAALLSFGSLGIHAAESQPRSGANSKSVRLALLSDTHIAADPANQNRNFFPTENLRSLVPAVAASDPAAVLLNGDAARLAGEPGDYEALRGLLAPLAEKAPVLIGLGNHDHRANFSKVFPAPPALQQTVTGKHVLVFDPGPVRIVLLDSLLYVNQVAGLLGVQQREWLGKFLKQSDRKPTILFVHHTLGEGDGELLDVDRLFALIRPHRKVKAIFFGHSHKYSFTQRQGVHLVNLPAVGYNFSDTEPVGWVDSVFTGKGAKLTLRAIGGDRTKDNQSTTLSWRR
jgi:3',5'-cyclic AMP phosphodiesterase CpdA